MGKSKLRWQRIKDIGYLYGDIKKIVKSLFGYDVKEFTMDDFIRNIRNYKCIDEELLLVHIEKFFYKKLMIFSINNTKENPINEELDNPLLMSIFKETNRIYVDGENEYSGELDEIYRAVYLNRINDVVEIKMAAIREYNYTDIGELGERIEETNSFYDCMKFIIDLENELVYMFYNDFNMENVSKEVEITNKKRAFYSLFSKANNRTLIKNDISILLNSYIFEYLEEVKSGDIKKLISVIRTKSPINSRDNLASGHPNYEHNLKRLEAINHALKEEGHVIKYIEVHINNINIFIKHNGEISLTGDFFKVEVLGCVWNEIFRQENPFYITGNDRKGNVAAI